MKKAASQAGVTWIRFSRMECILVGLRNVTLFRNTLSKFRDFPYAYCDITGSGTFTGHLEDSYCDVIASGMYHC